MKKYDNAMGTAAGILLMLFALVAMVWVASVASAVMQNYQIDKDINSWLDRAQVANNPEDMKGYLINCRNGMINYGLTTGYGTYIFPTVEEYMPDIMKVLDSSIARCDSIISLPQNDTTYQVALDDLRGNIRELDLHSNGKYWADRVLFDLWVVLGGWVILIVLGIAILCVWD